MCTAIQELDRAAGKLGSPKVHLFIAEPHAPHPDSRARTQLAEIATNLRSRTEFALMTTSGIARATFTLMDLVIPSNPRKRNIAIGSLPAAYAHFEACRPGARALLVDMVRRLDQMYAREVSKPPPPACSQTNLKTPAV